MDRKIPATMVSQHPDHAGKPYWHHKEFISTRHEGQECFLSFSELGVSEYKWDWEGKLVDESVVERLLGEYFDFFKKNQLGRDKFLTFRLPNIRVQTEFRLGRAFMGLLSAAGLAKQVGLHSPPLFEVILPMTETAEEMIAVQEAFKEMASLKHQLHNLHNGTLKQIEIIPLFEQVEVMINSDQILKQYLRMHRQKFGKTPSYLRPYLARSDPALNAGLVPTILAIKIALSRYQKLEREAGIKLYPIIGSASLPFRGGLSPLTAQDFIKEYAGIRTALLQSAFRYDFELTEVKKAIGELERELPKGVAEEISIDEENKLREVMAVFESYYQKTVEKIAPLINEVASRLPKRRERVQHIGLFGYSRNLGKVSLPRAIGFTGSMYSLGMPPEIIGTGRGLNQIKKLGLSKMLDKYYLNLRSDLTRAGRFMNKKVIEERAKKEPVWKDILLDIKYVEEYLGIKLGPEKDEEIKHYQCTERIFIKLDKGEKEIPEIGEAALWRKSLG